VLGIGLMLGLVFGLAY